MDGRAGRESVLAALRAELVGPDPGGKPLATEPAPSFATAEDSYGPWVDAATGEEILQRDRPTKRYGIGVLYPAGQLVEDVRTLSDPGADAEAPLAAPDDVDTEAIDDLHLAGEADGDDFDLTAANLYRPSAMGLSFLVRIPEGHDLKFQGSGGRYRSFRGGVTGTDRTWWVRSPVTVEVTFPGEKIVAPGPARKVTPSGVAADGADGLDLAVEAFARPAGDRKALVTVAFINRSPASASADANSLFQTQFKVTVDGGSGPVPAMEPYPDRQAERLLRTDAEARSIALLYRSAPTFAVGHGCAANWDSGWGEQGAAMVAAEPLPTYEAPSITPDATLPDGTPLQVPMGPLAGLDPDDDGLAAAERVVDAYAAWLADLRVEAAGLTEHQDAAAAHLAACTTALERMRAGLEWIRTDPVVAQAFRLANRAVLYQQLRSRPQARATTVAADGRYKVEPAEPVPDWRTVKGKGRWYAFQIGFLLAALRSAADPDDPDRETVELIFFPTGGGKTEAYSALAAFCLLYHRLIKRSTGVSVLMRYTLRLLTAQQFTRAAGLICALEKVRKEEEIPGDEFSIGIWVGESTTPTRRNDARQKLNKLLRRPRDEPNPFLLLRCPWCAAQMGVVEPEPKSGKSATVAGYTEMGGTVRFRCPDRNCAFRGTLPIWVIDEDIYDHRPSLVIGTVDKFAMLTWRPQARAMFGLDPMGNRAADPPNLIIQDELHLIAGPLGSVVGLYEGIIEELCTDRRGGVERRPKIVCSTATIRRYGQQIKALYARDRAALFPPHGFDASDSFFARYARDPATGELAPGRLYVGVHAPGLGSIQTAEVRTFSALFQAGADLPEDERDPWWSLLVFFNSLRELGTSVSLLQSDIPDYLLAMKNRRGTPFETLRKPRHVMELTSRLRQDEIPQAIDKLERPAADSYPVDACLASNIIEVGIDIPRLSLMCVVGQPKSTSQYIQVTGRVGRNWLERPGLVVTIYGASKPRDRSHFEKFRSYHQRLYAQVEPVSVTPFAQPVLKRALHAALCTYVRQAGPQNLFPWPVPEALLEAAGQVLSSRVAFVDDAELAGFKKRLEQRLTEWREWERNGWEATLQADSAGLMRRAGQWVPAPVARVSWSTPMSMRDVDAECRAEVTTLYAAAAGAVSGDDE